MLITTILICTLLIIAYIPLSNFLYHVDTIMDYNFDKIMISHLKNVIRPGDLIFYKHIRTPLHTQFLLKGAVFDDIGIIDSNLNIVTSDGIFPLSSLYSYPGNAYIARLINPIKAIKYKQRHKETSISGIISRLFKHHSLQDKKYAQEYIAEILYLSNITHEPYYQFSLSIQNKLLNIINNGQVYHPITEIIINDH